MTRRLLILLLGMNLFGCDKPANDSWQGYIEGEFVLLASPYAGQVQKLYVHRGDKVDLAPQTNAQATVHGTVAHVGDVIDLFRPFNLFFQALIVLNSGAVAAPGSLQNLFANKDRAIDAQGQGYGVARS